MLSFPWGVRLDRYKEFDAFFKKHYSVKANNYYKSSYRIHHNMYWGKDGYRSIVLESERSEEIQNRFDEILQKKKFIFYGAGEAAEKLITYFKKQNIRLPDELWDIDAANKTGFDLPVKPPCFDTLNNEECGMLVTVANTEVIRKIYQNCEAAGFKNLINICIIWGLGDPNIEPDAEKYLKTCRDVKMNYIDVARANRIDMEYQA